MRHECFKTRETASLSVRSGGMLHTVKGKDGTTMRFGFGGGVIWMGRATFAHGSDDRKAASLLLLLMCCFSCDDTRGPDDWPQGNTFITF